MNSATLEAPPTTGNSPAAGAPWIYGPWLDLLAGCGGWSAPLLLLAFYGTAPRSAVWPLAFYFFALLFNYPHFMATVYRAYHSRSEFQRYRIFTVHVAVLLAIAGVLAHLWFPLLPWIFTLYICWSPWHYTGQNFGLLVMFARRGGAPLRPLERRLVHVAFLASFLMLMLSFHTGPSGDPMIVSLALPARFTVPARAVLAALFAASLLWAVRSLSRRASFRALGPVLLLASTQFLWFLLPAAIELLSGRELPQTRYSSGILAVLHSVQYLWITSYYQRREAQAAGTIWSVRRYFLTLVAGGIALFVPGPWIASRVFHADFAASVLTFTALVNLHHFLLDGALWKLRDSRVGRLLGHGAARATGGPGAVRVDRTAWTSSPGFPVRLLRISALSVLFLWAALDQLHFFWASRVDDGAALLRAARLNEQDSSVQLRLARLESAGGHPEAALRPLRQAAAVASTNSAIQERLARGLIAAGHTEEAYAQYRAILDRQPGDPNALVNYGLLAAELGRSAEAIDSWQRAVSLDPRQGNAQLYLAQALEGRGELQAAARHYRSYVALAQGTPSRENRSAFLSAIIKVADADAAAGHADAAETGYATAQRLARESGAAALESLALAHQADLLDRSGQAAAAAASYQQALALDQSLEGDAGAAADWFNYAQFLRRRKQPAALVYACLLRAEARLPGSDTPERRTIQQARGELESSLGTKAANDARRSQSSLAAEALSWKPDR